MKSIMKYLADTRLKKLTRKPSALILFFINRDAMSLIKNSTSSKILYISTVGFISVFFFAISVLLFGTGFSFAAQKLNFSSYFSTIPLWQYLVLVGVPVFFLANIILFYAENFIEDRFEKMVETFSKFKVVILFFFFLLFFVGVYFF